MNAMNEGVDVVVSPRGDSCHDGRAGHVLAPSVAALCHDPLERPRNGRYRNAGVDPRDVVESPGCLRDPRPGWLEGQGP
eukprot:4409434-Alexandrium_andersonii.AAC.1